MRDIATLPYFIFSPNALISVVGLLRRRPHTPPPPEEDWRQWTVDVVIPAFNEAHNIPLCLASLSRQTLKPRNVILVDDGSKDRTLEYAKDFCHANDINLTAIRRSKSIGKTPTLKLQSRSFDSDVLFILDADTLLESDEYIARLVEELHTSPDIASACGAVLPLREKDRRAELTTPALRKFLETRWDPELFPTLFPHVPWRLRAQRAISNIYRDTLYLFLQKFLYRGQLRAFGTMLNPVGCAVAYRRRVLRTLIFDQYEPHFGDNLTNSEDIFIGFALNNMGFRNVQVTDVYARSVDPPVNRLPRQINLWSSSFLQSCYYFDELVRSPFKLFRRLSRRRAENRALRTHDVREKRHHEDPFRQPYGGEYTAEFGRPIGWVLFMSAFEKVSFPTILIVMMTMQAWEPLAVTLAAETLVSLMILTLIAKGRRLEYLLKGITIAPLRYILIVFDFVTILRFAKDLWITRNRRWRK